MVAVPLPLKSAMQAALQPQAVTQLPGRGRMTLVVAGQATARQLLVHTAALPLVKAPGAARQMSRAAAGGMGMCQTKR